MSCAGLQPHAAASATARRRAVAAPGERGRYTVSFRASLAERCPDECSDTTRGENGERIAIRLYHRAPRVENGEHDTPCLCGDNRPLPRNDTPARVSRRKRALSGLHGHVCGQALGFDAGVMRFLIDGA